MNLYRKSFLALLSGIILFSCTSQKESVIVHIDGWGDEMVLIDYYTFSAIEGLDTVYMKNGSFNYDPPLEDITSFTFYRVSDYYPRPVREYMPYAKRIELVLFPGDRVRIEGVAGIDAVDYSVSGSDFMKDWSKIRNQTLIYQIQIDSAEFGLIAAMERNAPGEEEEVFFSRRRALNHEIREVERDYIRRHPDNELSAMFVLQQPLDSFPGYYMLLSKRVQEGHFKSLLDARNVYYDEYQVYQENKKVELRGQIAPDFILTDIKGEPFIFSGFETDKYIILDFWGSWCGPCLAGMPEMKRYYDKYKDHLEIIGIACKDKEESWKKAIMDNTLPWIHLFNDHTSLEKNITLSYAIGAYPTKILLSPDKTIMEIFVGEGEDFYQKLDELLM